MRGAFRRFRKAIAAMAVEYCVSSMSSRLFTENERHPIQNLPPISQTNDLLQTMTEKFEQEDWDAVMREFRDAQYAGSRVDSDTYNLAIRSCRRSANVQGALMLLHEMRDEELVRPDLISFNACLNSLSEAGDWKTAMRLLGDMKAEGIQPDVISYHTTIYACGKANQWQTALQLFEDMQNDGLDPDDLTYTAVIHALCQAGELDRAGNMLSDMHGAGVRPTAITYSCMLSGCEKQGNWELALCFIAEFMTSGLPLDPTCFNTAIRTCANNGHLQEAESIFRQMTKLGIDASSTSIIALFGATFVLES